MALLLKGEAARDVQGVMADCRRGSEGPLRCRHYCGILYGDDRQRPEAHAYALLVEENRFTTDDCHMIGYILFLCLEFGPDEAPFICPFLLSSRFAADGNIEAHSAQFQRAT